MDSDSPVRVVALGVLQRLSAWSYPEALVSGQAGWEADPLGVSACGWLYGLSLEAPDGKDRGITP